MNTKRIVDIGFVLAGVLVFLVLRQVLGNLWDSFRLPMDPDWIIGFPDVIAAAIGVGAYYGLRKNTKAKDFLNDVVIELSKVTWPVKKETLVSAFVVIIMVAIASMILFLFDAAWGSLTQSFLST